MSLNYPLKSCPSKLKASSKTGFSLQKTVYTFSRVGVLKAYNKKSSKSDLALKAALVPVILV